MPVHHIPKGYHSITPYIIVPNVARLIDFLKAAFGAEETERMARPDGTIMHAEVRIGDSSVMMGEPQDKSGGMPSSLYLYVPDTDATYRLAIAAGGTSITEPADQFYGDRNAGVQDPCGNKWWIGTHMEDVSREELERRAAAQKPR